MSHSKAALLALCILVLATPGAFAQANNDWGKAVDLKPMLPPMVPPILPPNSVLTPGAAIGDSVNPYGTPLNDPTRSQATPGLRLTIPTR